MLLGVGFLAGMCVQVLCFFPGVLLLRGPTFGCIISWNSKDPLRGLSIEAILSARSDARYHTTKSTERMEAPTLQRLE